MLFEQGQGVGGGLAQLRVEPPGLGGRCLCLPQIGHRAKQEQKAERPGQDGRHATAGGAGSDGRAGRRDDVTAIKAIAEAEPVIDARCALERLDGGPEQTAVARGELLFAQRHP